MLSTSRRLVTGLCVLTLALTTAGPAVARDSIHNSTGSQALPSSDRFASATRSHHLCKNGSPRCVRATIRQMKRHFRPLARRCSHQAVFSLAYLRTTQEYARAAAEPGFFQDVRFVNHEDAVFAEYYFDAYDAWAANRLRKVPTAWRIAFNRADQRRVSGSGNLLLGMNAHVNRDLPFVLAKIGLVAPDGSSRKPDHDKVNVFLRRVVEPLLAEEAERFDPTMDDHDTPYGLGYEALFQVLVGWREVAWRHAEQLVNAPNPAARALVAAEIEDYAATTARELALAYRYRPLLPGAAERDAYCAAQAR